jgi:hypothetical protein
MAGLIPAIHAVTNQGGFRSPTGFAAPDGARDWNLRSERLETMAALRDDALSDRQPALHAKRR